MRVSVLAILAFIMLLGNVAFGHGNGEAGKTLKVEVIERKDNIVAIHFQKPETTKVKIEITNSNGKVVYTETVASYELAIKKYDLSELPTGKYTIEISGGKEVYTQFVRVQ